MLKLAITGAVAMGLMGGVAFAQPVGGQTADAANAASLPLQGTLQVLAAPGAEPRTYPLCSRTVTDQCVNPREAGRGYGNRPLDDWPGHPASEPAG